MNDSQTVSEFEACCLLGDTVERLDELVKEKYLERTGEGENRRYLLEGIWVLMDETSGWTGFSHTHDIEIKITPKPEPVTLERWGVTYEEV